jgi:hypothetical protein
MFLWQGSVQQFKSGPTGGGDSPTGPIIIEFPGQPNIRPGTRCQTFGEHGYICELPDGQFVVWDSNRNVHWYLPPGSRPPIPPRVGSVVPPRRGNFVTTIVNLPLHVPDPDAAEIGHGQFPQQGTIWGGVGQHPLTTPPTVPLPPPRTQRPPRTPRPPRSGIGLLPGVGQAILGGAAGAALGTACEMLVTECGHSVEEFEEQVETLDARLQRMRDDLGRLRERLREQVGGCPMTERCRNWGLQALQDMLNALNRIQQLQDQVGTIIGLIRGLDVGGLGFCELYALGQCTQIIHQVQTVVAGVSDREQTVAGWETAVADFLKYCGCAEPIRPARPVYVNQ